MGGDDEVDATHGLNMPRPSPFTLQFAAFIGLAVAAAFPVRAAPPPTLPTKCGPGSSCGSAATSFLQFGSATAAMSGSNTLNVTQTTTQAIVNWANFNIAHGYTVNFIQPSATAAILNNIWSVDPSIIAGQMRANGQVYLYNQNGIVFANGAQINVAGLTASTLPFAPVASSTDPNALFENGILSQNTAGVTPPAAFVAPATGSAGTVTVNPGATLTAADGGRIMLLGSAVSNSGTISTPDGQTILAAATGSGPNTPAVYLAASTDPSMRGLLIEVNGGGVSGTGANSPNTVTNAGQITAARGNITLAGLVVNQEGMLSATTSVSANGSIYLLAGDVSGSGSSFIASPKEPLTGESTAFGGLSPTDGGTLLLTPGSVTQVLPDTTGNGTLTEPQQASFIPSQVNLAGRVIALDGNASIHAPGGLVNVYASPDPAQLIASGGSGTEAAGGSVYLDTDSSIDVSGLKNVSVPVTQNIVQVTLETDDLQNDPLQRNGFLHGATVTVNINDPPSLFSVTPYAQNIGEGIDQVLTTAGTISLQATGNVIARAGSTLNVSGGSIAYQSGYGPSTTNLVGANGVVYNISTAPSNVPYVGIAGNYSYTDPTWGTTVSGSSQTYYAGYLQGNNAGTINIDSPAAYLRGTLSAQTVDGPYQRLAASPAGSLTGLPAGGTLILGCSTCVDNTGLPSYGLDGGISFANNLSDTLTGNVVVDGYVVSSVNVPALTELSPAQLAQGGFNTINVSSNGAIAVPAGVDVSLAANGRFVAQSALSVNIDGQIDAPGGSVSLTTAATADNLAHDITLGAGAVIDVSGGWTNDSPSVTVLPGTAPVVIDGGSVSASAAGNIMLGAGSLINVSGGGWMNQSSQLSEGSAGTISLAANLLATQGSVASVTNPYVGTIDFGAGATLLGASLKAGNGGTLALQSGSVTVGTTAAGTPGELLLAPGFFDQGGFAQYVITGQNDVIIGNLMDTADSAPITVKPIQQNLVFTKNAALQPTGSNLAGFTQIETLLPSLRQPASVDFIATADDPSGAQTGSVTLARDASIVTDPGASVELAASGFNGNVLAFGSILAPAGNITLQINPPDNTVLSSPYISNQQIELGPDAVLAAPAYALINTLDPLGYAQGSVLAGGTVTLLANKGYVVTDPGSVVDVSGTVGTLDIVQTNGVTPTTVAGNAGTININAREGIVLQGSLLGQAASLNGSPVSGAAGGTLNVGLGNSNLGMTYNDSGSNATGAPGQQTSPPYPTTTRTLTVAGVGANGQPAVPPSNQLLSGTAVINVDTIEAGGFDNVALYSADTIAFTGAVALQANASLTLDAPLFVANRGAQVSLTSAYVAVGNSLNNPDYFDFSSNTASPNATAVLNPTAGAGTLAVNAQLVDIRGISGWSGFATENFTSTGDIRLVDGANQLTEPLALQPSSAPALPSSINVSQNPGFEGEFNTSAAVTLQGAQVYPTTATTFAINDLPGTLPSQATPAAATVTIAQAPGATSATPLSAGGTLIVNATNIVQDGTLRAPLGQIALNGVPVLDTSGNTMAGTGMVTLSSTSLTSVSADGLTIPYGETSNGTEWTYSPSSIVTNVISAPPSKQISLNGSAVTVNGQVDLAGGGDLYAYEFVAGEGGSVDVLDQASLTNSARAPGTTVFSYAIVPGLGSAFAPIDPQYAQSSSVGPNQTIYLSGVPGLAAGTYALLPAHYALLPGAFAVTVVQSDSGIIAGSAVAQPNGSYVVAGRFGIAGTSTLDSLTSTVDVASNATVNTLSQYTSTYANAFFSSAAATAGTTAPSLPADAGQLLLSAGNSLALNGAAGSINFARGSFSSTNAAGQPITVQGLGGDVSITAPSIEVVDAVAAAPAASATAGTMPAPLQLGVQELNNLDAQTLILGATSANTSAGEQLTLGSTQTVELANKTTALTGPDIILAAQDSVMVDAGAQITASGTGAQMPSTLVLPTGGALLRVSSAAPAALVAGTNTGTSESPLYSGTVSIGAGATVQSSGSLLLYGSNTTTLDPTAQVSSPAVALYSSQVSLGDVPTGAAAPSGLNLTAQLLGGFQGLTNLTIGSTSTIDFYGNVTLGTAASAAPTLQSISLDAGGLRGYGTSDDTVLLHAGSVTLTNSGAALPPTDGTGTGTLQILAGAINDQTGSGQITLGAGTKIVSGFSAVNLQAAGNIVGQGTGTLQVDGNAVPVTLTSAALVGAAGATQTIATPGAVTINPSSPGNLALPAPGPGAAFTILAGGNIQQNGSIDLPSGSLTLTAGATLPAGNGSAAAVGSGSVTLGAGSMTSVAGATQSYTVTDAVAAGGQISLTANTGNVVIGSGATVDVSGASASVAGGTLSSDAGSLSVSAPQGTFSFAAGSILKGGAAAGQQQGSFTLDESYGLGDSCPAGDACLSGAGFAALAAMLSSGGFTGAIDLRTRTDTSVTIAGTVQASSFELSADQGSITVAGTGVIDTSGRSSGLDTAGGPIELWAGDSLTLQFGAKLLANAGSPGPVGAGGTALASPGGNIALGISCNDGIACGTVDLQPGSIIDLQGSAAGSDGTLTVRAPVIAAPANGIYTAPNGATGAAMSGPVDVAITEIGSAVMGQNPVIVEGYNVYQLAASGVLSQPNSDALANPAATNGPYTTLSIGMGGVLFANANNLIQNSAALSRLEGTEAPGGPALQLRPGIEVQGAGDLQVGDPGSTAETWNLDSWNTALGGVPVNLTLRAAGNLIFNASLSDGFQDTNSNVTDWTFGESTADPTGASGSYRLVAGADLTAANPLAVVVQTAAPLNLSAPASGLGAPPNSGNFILTPGSSTTASNVIRTGTGSIDIAAGGDVLLGYSVDSDSGGVLQVTESDPLNAVIYTAGVPSPVAPTSLFAPPLVGKKTTVSYPTDGGNISAFAGDDIRSATSAQLVSNWLGRAEPTAGTAQNTTWWIEFNNFDQGIGVLGGGNLSLTAGRDIVNVSAVVPTTGRVLLAEGGTPVAADLSVTGGGTLRVQAGGDIVSGVFEDDWGNASISAGGALTSSGDSTYGQVTAGLGTQEIITETPSFNATELYPILVVGNGVFDVSARSGIALDGITNSTTLPLVSTQVGSNAAFFPYAPTSNPSTLNLVSAGGDVDLNNDPAASLPIAQLSNLGIVYNRASADADDYLAVYPSTLNVASLSGNINLGDAVTLFPSATGNLTLLAAGSINSANGAIGTASSVSITVSESNPALVPNPLAPVNDVGANGFPGVTGVALPAQPLHQNDAQPIMLVADTGNIDSAVLNFPKAADVIAGGNIMDLMYTGKNLNPSDVTLIEAGGQIEYSTPTIAGTNALNLNTNGITLGGPGYLEVLAGGAVNLGDGNGIVTSGALSDVRLPSTGATVVVGAGLGTNADGSLRQPDNQAFIQSYLDPNATTGAPSAYAADLIGYMQQLYPAADANLSYPAALSAFNALTPAQQLPLLSQVLSDELSATGLAHTLHGASYAPGFTAIDTLFPTTSTAQDVTTPLTYSGDLDLFFSQVKTEQGGDIDLLVPGGSVIAGVANPPATLNTIKQTPVVTGPPIPAAANLGLLVLGQGAIQGFADENFTVDQSRILTLEGGNIILWASNGNIDAGAGAKSASAAPPPTIETNSQGDTFVDPANSVVGSGIGQLLSGPGETAGLVNLIAPNGDVNAGDAGIRVAGNLNIAAVQVIGAANITVVGTSTGVPVSEAGAFAGALSGANSIGDTSKNAVAALTSDIGNSANYQQMTDSLQPSFIVVKMFCLGVECETH
jgi:filamentous hemagglutinin family protein